MYVITVFTSIGGFLFGYDTGVVSGSILFIETEYNLSSFEIELFVSIAVAGAIVGSIISGPVSDKLGRKKSISFSAILFVGGSIVLGFAPKYSALIVGRFIVGFAIGVAANVVPLYIAEISPAKYRGSLVTINNLCITSGQFISYLVASGFSHVNEGWRYTLGLAAIPALIMFFGMVFIVPESPRWLYLMGQEDEAISILKRIRNTDDVEEEVQEIKESRVSSGMSQFKSILYDRVIRRALLIGCSLQFFQQFCGINTVMYYSASIIKMAGINDNSKAVWFSTAVAGANAVFTVVSLFLIDRVGRRKLLLSTMIGMIAGLLFLGLAFFFSYRDPKSTGIFAIVSLVLYVAFFATGMGPIPWAVNSEIYPSNFRGIGCGIATTVNWSANLVVSFTFLSYVNAVTPSGAFWTYAGIGIVAWVVIYFILPETKGKSIEQIQQSFSNKSTPTHTPSHPSTQLE